MGWPAGRPCTGTAGTAPAVYRAVTVEQNPLARTPGPPLSAAPASAVGRQSHATLSNPPQPGTVCCHPTANKTTRHGNGDGNMLASSEWGCVRMRLSHAAQRIGGFGGGGGGAVEEEAMARDGVKWGRG